MARLRIQLRPNLQDGGVLITPTGHAPFVPRGGLYSLNYKESAFKRISIFRYKNGWLNRKLKGATNKSLEVGQIALSDRRGLKALGLENLLLKNAVENPLILTSDEFLQPHHGSTPAMLPPPQTFDHDPFLGHKDLRGKSINELKEYFEGPSNEDGTLPITGVVSHISQLVPGQRAFLAPQTGRLKKNITLASGESATVVVAANLPRDSYILVDELPNRNNSITLEGLHVTQAVSLWW